MHTLIEYIAEQDGNKEREFKNEISKILLASAKPIRAYLVLAKYILQHTFNIILCIRTNDKDDGNLLKKCSEISRTMIVHNQQVELMFISAKEESQIRKLCCPFFTSYNFNAQKPDFFLYSNDYDNLHDTVRNCFKRKHLYGGHVDGYMLCDIDPPLIGQPYGLGSKDITQIIIAARHKDTSLFPITEPIVYVYVMRPLVSGIESKDTIEQSDVDLIAWGEIYQHKDAIQKYNLR